MLCNRERFFEINQGINSSFNNAKKLKIQID